MSWLSGWNKRKKLIIDSSKVDSNLSDFPILIHLSNSSGISNVDITSIFDELGSNDKKIALTTSDGTTQCSVEIERWDSTNEEAWLWTKIPSIDSTANTELYLYYDSTQADNTTYIGDIGSTPGKNVWDSNYKGVWHLSQDPSGGSGCIKDSTINANHGTPGGSMTSEDLVDGKIGKGLDFDGDDDRINLGTTLMNGISKFTVSAIVKADSFTAGAYSSTVFSKSRVSSSGQEDVVDLAFNTDKIFMLRENSSHVRVYLTGTTQLNTDYWYQLTYRYDGSYTDVYINGDSDSSSPAPATGVLNSSIIPVYIGINHHDVLYSTDYAFDGIIVEVRLSYTDRSDSWIKASYYSGEDNLVYFEEVSITAKVAGISYGSINKIMGINSVNIAKIIGIEF